MNKYSFKNLGLNEVIDKLDLYLMENLDNVDTVNFLKGTKEINWEKLYEENKYQIIQKIFYVSGLTYFAAIRNQVPMNDLNILIDKQIDFLKDEMKNEIIDNYIVSYFTDTKLLCYNEYYLTQTVPVVYNCLKKMILDEERVTTTLLQNIDGFYHLLENIKLPKKEKEGMVKGLYEECNIEEVKRHMEKKQSSLLLKETKEELNNDILKEKKSLLDKLFNFRKNKESLPKVTLK